jgi:hypothetical protein
VLLLLMIIMLIINLLSQCQCNHLR